MFLLMRTSDDENVEPVIIGTTNTVEPDVNNDFQPETQQSPEVSRPTGKKFQQNRRNITTKIGRKNIPPNIPYVSINGINVQCWKYVVQRKTADERDAISAVSLNVKYVILHKIGIVNWFSSSHASSVFVALGAFLYQICHDDTIDTSSFIYNQLLRHVRLFGVKITIALPRFFSGLLLHLNVAVLTTFDASRPESKTLSMSYIFFQGGHVPDIEHEMRHLRAPRMFDTNDWDENAEGFFVNRELASRIINTYS
ncbi:uncharacterized protein E5676_scaffold458G00090 [Cucumis melo var. makuwa]|uniref:Envelope-like protein n=1 Tax=Cucumis melo var. makuwa TaxID=1194695 RepID=A0A5D3CCJ8_CUCMM|nr:uncharacterized protein E5676_scaffold458G00090 [Cucumis melo var. makuwa]